MASPFFNQEFKNTTCAQLAAEIRQLRDELSRRVDQLRADALKLPTTGPFSVKGHLQQMEGKQVRLRKLLNEYTSRRCGDGPGGNAVPADAWRYATAERPVSVPETAQMSHVTTEGILKVAAVLGLAAATVAVVFSSPALAGAGILSILIANS